MFSPELGDWSWWISTAGGLYRLVKHDRKRPCFALWKSAERARLRKADWIFSPSVSSRMISKLGSMPPILVHWATTEPNPCVYIGNGGSGCSWPKKIFSFLMGLATPSWIHFRRTQDSSLVSTYGNPTEILSHLKDHADKCWQAL
jgi:hypothetical protein